MTHGLHARLSSAHVLVASAVLFALAGCVGSRPPDPDGVGRGEGKRQATRAHAHIYDRCPWFEFVCALDLDSRDPKPTHAIYAGLRPEVKQALLRLNRCSKREAFLHENPWLYRRESLAVPFGESIAVPSGVVYPSHEAIAWIEINKGAIRQLGLDVKWNNAELLYEIRP